MGTSVKMIEHHYGHMDTWKRFKTNSTIQQVFKDFGDVTYQGSKYVAFAKRWRTKVSVSETRGEYLFSEPLITNKVDVVENIDVAEQMIRDKSNLLFNIPKSLTRKQIDTALERIFGMEMTFEKGRQTRHPNQSNARYMLSSPVKVENMQMTFAVYGEFKLAETANVKLSNYKVAKKLGLIVHSKVDDKLTDVASERRAISVAMTRKKKTATDGIANIVKGIFP
jgi:ribosomal protein L23